MEVSELRSERWEPRRCMKESVAGRAMPQIKPWDLYANSSFSSSEWQSPAQSITFSCQFRWHEERLLSACHSRRSNQTPLPPGVSVFHLKNPDVSATHHPNRLCPLTKNSCSIVESKAALERVASDPTHSCPLAGVAPPPGQIPVRLSSQKKARQTEALLCLHFSQNLQTWVKH